MNKLQCQKCNKNSIRFFNADIDEPVISNISTDQPELICSNCLIYYMYCPDCSMIKEYENGDEYIEPCNIDPMNSKFVLMKFLGHDLMCCHDLKHNIYGNKIYRNDKCKECLQRSKTFEYTSKDNKETIDIEASYIDKNLLYMDPNMIINGEKNILTGDDGGFYHYWYCQKCDKVYNYTDK